MPGSGDQHRENTATINPFEDPERRVSEFTAQEIATLSSRLEKQLGPEFISARPGASGQKVYYLAAEKCINLANEVFGFNGWSSSIRNVQIDFVEESQSTGKISLGLSVIVRVTLRDGTYHEAGLEGLIRDIGYGHIENCKGKAAAFEKAKKEGTTDAMKRALRNFGNVLGNCIYDKDYLSKITKVKIAPSKWDVDNLHRHPNYATVKKEPEPEPIQNGATHPTSGESVEDEFGEDFDEADFGEGHTVAEHPDEVVLDASISSEPTPGARNSNGSALERAHIGTAPPEVTQQRNSKTNGRPILPAAQQRSNDVPPQNGQQATHQLAQQPLTPGPASRNLNGMSPRPNMAPPQNHPIPPQRPPQQIPSVNRSCPNQNVTRPSVLQGPPQRQDHPVGFYPAKVATIIQESDSAPPTDAPTFNPHAESPSIRKTSGFDHSKSKPINRDSLSVPETTANARPPQRPVFTNPQLDATRKIGMPTSPGPMQNRTTYRPPGPATGKRILENSGLQQARAPLNDMSINTTADGPGDPKKSRLSDP